MKTKALILGIGSVFALALSVATPPVAASSGSGWTVTVLSPTPGQVVTTAYLPLWLQSSGFRMDARYAGTPVLPTVGHVHEMLDGSLIDMVPTSPNGNSITDTISMVGVAPGLHYLTVVPARDDHSMVMSSAVTVPFYYEGPYVPQPGPFYFASAPAISVVSPAAGATVQGASFNLSVDVTNFVLSGVSFGKNNVDGVGHWHVFFDQPMMPSMKTMAFTDSQQVYLLNVPNGWHTFYVVLVNNQHMPFMVMNNGEMTFQPGTIASVTLYVDST